MSVGEVFHLAHLVRPLTILKRSSMSVDNGAPVSSSLFANDDKRAMYGSEASF